MGLLDIAAQALGGANTAGGSNAAIQEVVNMVSNYPGGIGGLVGNFEKSGLGGVVGSWVGNGTNQAITPQQVQAGVGSDVISNMASKLGVSPDIASGVLAQVLPHVVDHMTPGGQVPAAGAAGAGSMLGMGESILAGLLKR